MAEFTACQKKNERKQSIMALESILETLNAARSKYEEQKKEIKETGAKAIADVMTPLVPAGFKVTWTQYTPYFNDGDPCVFRVGDLELRRVEDDDEIYGAIAQEKALGDQYSRWVTLKEIWHKLPKDMLEVAFGDHREISVMDGKLVDEQYDHE